ncbi:MAG: hypothetical protein ABI123_04750 [Ginsengibacter sp.]|jgi:hypothetical protein
MIILSNISFPGISIAPETADLVLVTRFPISRAPTFSSFPDKNSAQSFAQMRFTNPDFPLPR